MKEEILQIVANELSKKQVRNPNYSMRAFANDLGIQVSALSEMLNGKRTVTKKMARKILTGLRFSAEEVDSLIEQTEVSQENLSLENFRVIAEWYHFAILSLAELEDFECSSKWITKRLNVTREEAQEAITRLLKLGMLMKNADGKIIASGLQYKTPSDIANAALKKHTAETLDLAKDSLMKDSVERRDFSTVTMLIDPSKIPEAKKMITDFRKKLSKKLESGHKKEVYKLAIQLFPIDKGVGHD